RGLFGGNLRLSGSLANLSPSAIQAEGDVSFSQGIAIITDPLTASVRWLGDRIEILEASARGFSGAGTIGVLLEGAGAPGISNLDLAVQLRDYAITNLPIPIPEAITVAGTTDFDGRVSGTIDALRVAGNLGLNNFAVNDAVFEPRLTGNFLYASNQRIDLNVAGARDRIAVNLDGQNRPQSFYVQWQDAIAEGRGEGDRLVATVQNFPLEALNIAPAAQLGLGEVAGMLNGRFNINLAELSNPSIVGELAVANPAIDYIKADSFTGKFRYFDGVGVLDDGELRRGGSRYLLAGTYNPYAETQFQGKVTAEPGRIEDIFAALQWFQLTDLSRGIEPPTYATAVSVETESVGNPNATILNQLRRYSEIVALRNLQIAQREEAEFLPDLSTLQGAFSGEVNLAYSSKTGPKLDFDLSGQDWQWGKYQVNQVIAQGGFDKGILTLRPVLLQSDDSVLKFTGQVGGEEQSGQLIAQNIPLEVLRDLFKLPLDVEGGTLSANAFLSGSLGNPQVLGEVLLADATLNQVDAPPFRTLFGYSNARLEVESRVVDDEQDTFRFTGSIPYRFPFMTVAPASNAFNLNLNIRNNGLALVSLFTDQIAWKGGEGDVQLQVNGAIDSTSQDQPKLSEISALGEATIQDATIGSRTLPEDITNVNGNIVFNTDRIQVKTLQGQFSNGELVAQGTLPLLIPLNRQNPEAEAPLTLSLNNLRLDLKNLYRGGVDGQVLLLGTALSPVISGDIRMHDGSVYIPDQASPMTTASTDTAAPALPGITNPPELQDFRVVLGDRLRVVKEPLLNFLVAGDFLLNGTQDDLRPDGTINLLTGQVNLFTTQFYLSRDHDNVAIFTPSRGLDPFLDVKLVASVPEVTRAPAQTSSLNSSEIADTPAFEYGALQTIRVEASVNGPASQIYNNLELTSSPRRSEAEIVALIGGSFINTLGQGNATTAIANLAGATLLTGLQNFITDATGLTDFRLFPTNVLSDDERSSALALGAELGVDITDRFSVSVLQILTAEDATRFNLRYRLTDQLTLRGSADTDGNSQAVLEFVTQF
ncbi:MAG TPA: translocation/assembly module TamB domain-containing protein, partial [Allocoleopsis sp.]